MKVKIIASKKYGSEYLKEQLLNAISKTSLEVVEDNYDLSIFHAISDPVVPADR